MDHFVVVVVCVIVFIISRRKQSHDIVGCQNKGQKTKFPGMFHGLFLMSEPNVSGDGLCKKLINLVVV